METFYPIGPASSAAMASSESELSGCLHYGLQKAAYDIRGSGVLLVQDLHVPCRGSEVTVAEPVPYPLQVDALVDQPRSMRVPDLVGRVPERQMGLPAAAFQMRYQVFLPMYSVGSRRQAADQSRSVRPVLRRLRERP
jgi:hypothetical protein